MTLRIPLPPGYRFWSVVYSHGWSVLPPFAVDDEARSLSLALSFRPGSAFVATMKQQGRTLLVHTEGYDPGDRSRLRRVVVDVLRIGQDLRHFHGVARKHPQLRWISRYGAGRILRAPSVFEDTVKMICTTNCSWSLTTAMITRLTSSLGERSGDRYTFPSAAAMADRPESFYRKRIKAGYRSPFLVELSQRVSSGVLDLEQLRDPAAPREVKEELLRSVKGVGPYAADNLLRLHDVFDTFAHDSWIRPEFSRRYHGGRKVSDRTIERRYKDFGGYRGLVYWLDMTRPWYEDQFGFKG